jgi:hypothetical protein
MDIFKINIRERLYPEPVDKISLERSYYVMIKEPHILTTRDKIDKEIKEVLKQRYFLDAKLVIYKKDKIDVKKSNLENIIKILKIPPGDLTLDIFITTFRIIKLVSTFNKEEIKFYPVAIGEIEIDKFNVERRQFFFPFFICAEGGI